MTELLATLKDALVDWLVHELSSFRGWQIVAYTLVTTHMMIAAVTI
jgi:stearoyl-CoA desaturase (delta-9 desaturase)